MPSRWVKVKTFKSLSTSKLEKKLQNFKSYNSFDIIEIKRVKSRLLCKMLYNVFTISTYQN